MRRLPSAGPGPAPRGKRATVSAASTSQAAQGTDQTTADGFGKPAKTACSGSMASGGAERRAAAAPSRPCRTSRAVRTCSSASAATASAPAATQAGASHQRHAASASTAAAAPNTLLHWLASRNSDSASAARGASCAA